MDDNLKGGLFFILGLAVGAVGVAAVSRGKINPRETVAGLVAGGMDVKDKVTGFIERGREELDDMMAEAEYLRQQKSAPTQGEEA